MYPELAPIAFISAFSLILPLPWHWRADSVATLAIMFWMFTLNLIYAIDAIIWSGNVDVVASVWCDISTKLIIGGTVGPPAGCLCICIRLLQVSAAAQGPKSWHLDVRRRQILEYCMCYLLPVFIMVLHYIVQGHRFDVYEDYGCRAAIYFSVPAIFLLWVPGLALSVAALLCAIPALINLTRSYQSIASTLANTTGSNFTFSHYTRLMIMSVILMTWNTAATSYTLGASLATTKLRPWTNFADVHSNFSRVAQVPLLIVPKSYIPNLYVSWWIVPISTFVFVSVFAFGKEAVEEYKKVFSWIRCHILPSWIAKHIHKPNGFHTLQTQSLATGSRTLASITQETICDTDSYTKSMNLDTSAFSRTDIPSSKLEGDVNNV